MKTSKHALLTTVIGSDDCKKTFEVKREWDQAAKKAIFIELYPTITVESADRIDTSTVSLLNKAASDLGLGSIRILNLYATVFSDRPTANQLYEDIDNIAYIESILDDDSISDYTLVIAWGNTLANHECTKNLKRQLLALLQSKGLAKNVQQLTADNLDTQSNPSVHPLYLGLRFSKDTWGLTSYPIDTELKKLTPSVIPTEASKNQSPKATKKKEGKNNVPKVKESV